MNFVNPVNFDILNLVFIQQFIFNILRMIKNGGE